MTKVIKFDNGNAYCQFGSESFLETLRKVSNRVIDLYFCRRSEDGIEEKVGYNKNSIRKNKSGLAVKLELPQTRECATFYISELKNISSFLRELKLKERDIYKSIDRFVYGYTDGNFIYAINPNHPLEVK